MSDTYWLDRWIQGETSFHQEEINSYLRQYWHELHLLMAARYLCHYAAKAAHFEVNDISILCGNFFDLEKEDLMKVSAVFDHASMVALPPEMRERYVHHLLNILTPATKILLITFDYPQSEMTGPPFAVSPLEVETLLPEPC